MQFLFVFFSRKAHCDVTLSSAHANCNDVRRMRSKVGQVVFFVSATVLSSSSFYLTITDSKMTSIRFVNSFSMLYSWFWGLTLLLKWQDPSLAECTSVLLFLPFGKWNANLTSHVYGCCKSHLLHEFNALCILSLPKSIPFVDILSLNLIWLMV